MKDGSQLRTLQLVFRYWAKEGLMEVAREVSNINLLYTLPNHQVCGQVQAWLREEDAPAMQSPGVTNW